MEALIPVVIKLQEAFEAISARNCIELPAIVSVGSQSSGKSSVIESIVGRDFLPRGSGIVTRCPLVLSLRRIDTSKPAMGMRAPDAPDPNAEFGEFLHKKGTKFYDFEEIRREIVSRTGEIAGNRKNISNKPISLTIHSPHVLDLTLVDLPGLTKVPVQDQPADIDIQIRNLVLAYIQQPNSLILALSPANVDLANSDSLKIAKEVDPNGDRTIGVLTKIDLMDQGTNALELLDGTVYPLKLGYYGVKCRSQQNIIDGMAIKTALKAEKLYFSSHSVYGQFADKMGIPFLSKSLNTILVYHIKKSIPLLNQQIQIALTEKENEFAATQVTAMTGDPVADVDSGPLVLHLINLFINAYADKLEGRFVKEAAIDLSGGSRINYIFHDLFRKVIAQIDPFEYLTEQEIQTAIKNASAMHPSLFVPEGAFEVLIRQQIARLLEPSLDCTYQVYEELRKIVIDINLPELAHYYKLQSKICDVMENVLDKCLTPTTEMIMNLFEIENATINTNHPDFVGSADSLLNLFQAGEDENDPGMVGSEAIVDSEGNPISKTYSLLKKERKPHGEDIDEFDCIEESDELKKQKSQIRQEEVDIVMGLKKSKTVSHESSHAKAAQADLMKSAANQDLKNSMFENVFGYEQKALRRQQEESKGGHMPLNQTVTPYVAAGYETNTLGGLDNVGDACHNFPQVELDNVPEQMKASKNQESARVIMETRVIQNLIQSYFNIVKKNISDFVPKAIMAFLINESRKIAQSELVSQIYRGGDLEQLLVEDPMIIEQRIRCRNIIQALKNAEALLNDVSKFEL